jgi:hypothetical protein
MVGLDVGTLAEILDERPRIVRELIDRETNQLTTERLIQILEELRSFQQGLSSHRYRY